MMQKKMNIKFVHIVAAPEPTALDIKIWREQPPSNQTLLTITATMTRITFVACTIIILLKFDAFKLFFIAQITLLTFINVIRLILVFALMIVLDMDQIRYIRVAMLISINVCAAPHHPTSGIAIKFVVLINIIIEIENLTAIVIVNTLIVILCLIGAVIDSVLPGKSTCKLTKQS